MSRLQQVEGQRLHRSLRFLFKNRKFGFHWTNKDTSFYDGKDVHVIYNVQRPHLKSFDEAESRIIRLGHAYHEVGHHLFDYLKAYTDWQKDLGTTQKEEWKDEWATCKKYPPSWLQFFGNFALDGRMERLLMLGYPITADYLEFVNYHWCFEKGYEKRLGTSRLKDFRNMYAHRVLGMSDQPRWHPDTVTLIDINQELIDDFLLATSTADCLTIVTRLMENVWPVLLEWMEEEGEEASDNPNQYASDMTINSNWGADPDQLEQNAKEIINSNKDMSPKDKEDSPAERFKQLMDRAKNGLENDQKVVDDEEQRERPLHISYGYNSDDNAIVQTTTEDLDLESFHHEYKSVHRSVAPLAKELERILQPEEAQTAKYQRRGRLMPHAVWRASHCNNTNIFKSSSPGKMGQNAFLGFMADISGSTVLNGSIEQIRASLTLILSAATKARIPSQAFAFTSSLGGTSIYRLKDRDLEFTEKNKAAVGGLTPKVGNRDVIALRYLFDMCRARKEEIRLALFISDGAPNFSEGENEATIRAMVKKANKEGIEFLCLFVGNDREGLECAKSMYGSRVIHAKKGLVNEMKLQITKLLQTQSH